MEVQDGRVVDVDLYIRVLPLQADIQLFVLMELTA